ncbi:MAG: 2-C-methyl-D-erythritol 4-phosphate cytidylyltransferase [Candidatus Kapaibacteriota bacterium]
MLGLVIAAGGTGKRIGGLIPKQFHTINGKPILLATLEKIISILRFDTIVITYPQEHYKIMQELLEKAKIENVELVEGGPTRFESIWNALRTRSIRQTDFVFVHDAVRPFVTKELIIRIYDAVLRFNAVAPGVKIKDTIKELDSEEFITGTIDRSNLVAIQTPQAFKTSLLISAYEKAFSEGKSFTDEAGVVEYFGKPVKFVEGLETNIKITTPQDLILANLMATLA